MAGRRLSGWVNYQDVFDANKGAGQKMNDAVYGGLETAGQAALDRLEGAKTGFRQAADRAGNRDRYNPDGGLRYDMPTKDAKWGGPGVNVDTSSSVSLPAAPKGYGADAENKLNEVAADGSAKAAAAAKAKLDATNKSLADAQQRSNDTYKGPRTLREYDPQVSSAIGDAAARINASAATQFGNAYKGATAGGGALDRAIMGAEGGNTRRDAMVGKFGSLVEQLRAEQAVAQDYAAGLSDNMDKRAAAASALIPGLTTDAEAQRTEADRLAQIARRDAERAKYDRDYFNQNLVLKRHGGRNTQIQRVYDPPRD